MLDEKSIGQSSRIIQQLIKEGRILKPKSGTVEFFLEQGKKSLAVAERLRQVQEEEGLDSNLWIINASYYSMFFSATSLLAKFNHRLNSEVGIHKMTYHALVYFFIKENNKLKVQLAEEYADAIKEAEEILQLGEKKIKELVDDFDFELDKRKIFTYELGAIAHKSKALTSLQRAKRFFEEINRLVRG